MPVKVVESNLNVLQAAKIRIRNVFANGCKIYLSFSSGKDSLCMANLVYEMILSGELDPKQLTVTFIDEEGLYPSMVDAAYRWRRNFLSVGAKFLWFCLPFKQVSVIDHLSSSESWITWEPGKEDVWMRKPPDFAIMYSPYLHYAGEMNYQTFCSKAFSDGIQLVGLRTAESLTRFKCIANTKMERITRGGKFYPIYDWKDSDVWLYIPKRPSCAGPTAPSVICVSTAPPSRRAALQKPIPATRAFPMKAPLTRPFTSTACAMTMATPST